MSKEVENISGSATREMNFATKSSNCELESFEISCNSFMPVTPLKPFVPEPRRVCEERQGHWFSEEGILFSNNNASLAKSHPSELSMSQQVHFGLLLTLANAAAPNDFENVVQLGNVNGESSSYLPVHNSQFHSIRYDASPATSSPAKQDVPLGLNLWSDNCSALDINLNGNSISSRPMYDLNFPPTPSIDAFLIPNVPSQFALVTPDHSRQLEGRNVTDGINLDGNINQTYSNKGEKPATTSVETMELQQFPKGLSSNIQSTKLQENHNVDKTEISKTPQQKPKRRKHRPKVVIEGKLERTPKPTTPKPEGYKESPTFKRKYVQKNKIKEVSTNAGPNTDFVAEKSCKRSLNFGAEGEEIVEREVFISELQAQNFSPIVESTSKVKLGDGIEIVLENTQVGLAYDLNCSMNKVLEEYILASDIQSINPQTPNKNNPRQINFGKGESQMVFSEDTLEKQSAPTSRNNLAEDKQARGLKRGNLHDYQSIISENWYNSRIPVMHFPMIYKKKRTEKINCLTISKTAPKAPQTNEYTSTRVGSFTDFHEKELSFNCKLGADLMGKMKKKRSKVPTRAREFASLMAIIECGKMIESLNHSHSPKSIEALVAETQAPMKKKKRRKRLSFTTCTSSGVLKKRPSTVEEITELMGSLYINNERNQERNHQNKKLVPFNSQFEDQTALPFYQGDGTIVPFMGPVKKRKPRPKVDLDEETNRVWMLLLENINSEGVNGTNDERAKWWENERRVFKGRADSFIARMHLVQGDRRFSPWKGSVLDSVIGVFLTQNVSDHLSSSAFMSMAARFPLKSEDNSNPFGEGTSTVSEVSEICILDLEDTANWKNEKSNGTAAEKVVNTNDSIESSSTSVESKATINNNFLNIFGKGLQIDNTTISDREALDDALFSQFSAKYPKDSVNSSGAQPGTSSNSNYNSIPSFVELLQMAESSQGHYGQRANLESIDICTSDQSAVTAESVSHIMVQNMTENLVIGQATDNIQSEIESSSVIKIKTSTEHKEVESSLKAINISYDSSQPKKKTGKQKQKGSSVNWDNLRVEAQANGKKRERNSNTMNSLDWEAVRCADVNEIADTIKERGMNNILAERIKDFLDRLVKEHGSTDLEWLRDVPPDKAKEYLLSVRGLGLKSVECVRLLTLHHLAFPVDTNVGRIAVRLGWVPLQPLPESLQLHLLELYPVLESIQRYLWPRLCKLDQRTLYELHYQMITFGKVFCTKSKPNCNACPMRGECRHFASAFASIRLALPGLEEKSILSANEDRISYQNSVPNYLQLQLHPPPCSQQIQLQCKPLCGPIIEVPSTPDTFIVEVPASPEIEEIPQTPDIEDAFCEDPNEIPTIKLNIKDFAQNLQNYLLPNMEFQEGVVSKALVALTPEAASIPTSKLKNVNRLRTEHSVYELPDTHPLLEGMDKRERDDPCSYLLAIWTPGETASSITPPEGRCKSQELEELCDNTTCFSCNSIREANSQTVRGTILIPCRTAMRGSFPLNGTYFQVNEVFADHDSSIKPIDVPRAWIWNLPRRTVYFGTSIPSIFKGLSTECIQYCFWRGFVCVRGFDQKSRGPRPLMARLHFPASKLPRK